MTNAIQLQFEFLDSLAEFTDLERLSFFRKLQALYCLDCGRADPACGCSVLARQNH